ncbi:hypothetical protein [Gemmatimonas sp. UBA7669]|nr:hypothetical protein [Gemmatimonas sp. UBA7669]
MWAFFSWLHWWDDSGGGDPPDPIDPVGGEDTADILRRKRHRHGGKGGK